MVYSNWVIQVEFEAENIYKGVCKDEGKSQKWERIPTPVESFPSLTLKDGVESNNYQIW